MRNTCQHFRLTKPEMDTSLNVLATLLILITSSYRSVSAFCPVGCTCTDDSLLSPSVECDGIGLTSIPILFNPRIRSLTLSNNRISSVALDDLGFYSELEYLDLSNNKILTIERGSFYRLQKLKKLRLNGNLLATLSIETFTGLNELRHLDLSENGLRRLGTSVFSDLRRLEALNVSKNSINHYSPGALAGLSSLKQLYSQYNELTTIPSVALRPLPSLRVLDLSYNRIERIEDNSFAGLKELDRLNLGNNIIDTVDERAFYGLRALRQLSLDSSRLRRVPTISFRPLTDLLSLSLNENHLFTEIPTSAFEGLRLLRRMEISRCSQLERVELNAFSGLSSLETLVMTENRMLSKIDPMAFEYGSDDVSVEAVSPLRQFYIYGNNFTSLPKSLLPWSRLDDLDLRRNPWQCDCEFGPWIGGVLKSVYSEGQYPDGATCKGPEQLRGVPLHSLRASPWEENGQSDFDYCQSTGNVAISVAIGIVVAIACLSLIAAIIVCFGCRRKLPFYGCCTTSSYDSVAPMRCRYSAPPGLPELCRYSRPVQLPGPFYQDDQDENAVRKLLAERRKPSEGDYQLCGSKYNDYPGETGPALYEEPDHQYASCSTSGYYSCVVSEDGSTRVVEVPTSATSHGSFRILQQHPIPVTEL